MAPTSGRRIINLQAVLPCDGVDPGELLVMLMELVRRITCRRIRHCNARELVREAGVLLALFQEVRERYGKPPPWTKLCFSELYLVLRKVDCLLEDIERCGSRLWLLMNSDRVATELRILAREVATALDILTFRRLHAATEIEELVCLVKKQAWQAPMAVDAADRRVAKDVWEILRGFERKEVPASCCLRRILDHLQIRSWDLCNEEIRFLEEEFELETSSGNDRDAALIEGLVGFLLYCRCEVFDTVKERSGGHAANIAAYDKEVAVEMMNVDDFRCPISLELMTDPVTLETGQTYDRPSILQWFNAGNLTCPKTGEKLSAANLIPNTALRNLIQQFCRVKGIELNRGSGSRRTPGATLLGSSTAAMEARKMIFDLLADRLLRGNAKDKGNAAHEIRLLTKLSVGDRPRLASSGAIPALIDLLCSSNPVTQENAICALLNLSKDSTCKRVIMQEGGLKPILRVLRKGDRIESRQAAAATVFYLSSIDECRRLIGEIPEAIPALVDLIRSGTTRGKKNAVIAIFALLLVPGNHQSVLDAGAVPYLAQLLANERNELVNDSLAVIARLAEQPEGSEAIIQASMVPILVNILHSGDSAAMKEYCVSALLSLCINGGHEVVAALSKTPSLTASLYMILTTGTSRANRKASSLLKILHNFHCLSSNARIHPIQGDYVLRVQ